jgi:hypothetical protein
MRPRGGTSRTPEHDPTGGALAYVATPRPAYDAVLPARPLTPPQRQALGAVAAAGTVALLPVLRWFLSLFRDEPRRAAD